MLNQLTGKDDVKLPVQIKVAGVAQSRVVALGLQRLNGCGVDIDPDDVGDLLGEKPVEPVGTPVTGRAADIEQRFATDQRSHDFKPITQRPLAPRTVAPLRLKEMPCAT